MATRKARPKKAKQPRYKVHVAGIWRKFTFGTLWRQSLLFEKFRSMAGKIEFFPGLILQDGQGDLWKPKLHVELVPYIPEETNAT